MARQFFDLTKEPATPAPDLFSLEARIEDVFTLVYAMYLNGARPS